MPNHCNGDLRDFNDHVDILDRPVIEMAESDRGLCGLGCSEGSLIDAAEYIIRYSNCNRESAMPRCKSNSDYLTACQFETAGCVQLAGIHYRFNYFPHCKGASLSLIAISVTTTLVEIAIDCRSRITRSSRAFGTCTSPAQAHAVFLETEFSTTYSVCQEAISYSSTESKTMQSRPDLFQFQHHEEL